jgi:hypothetical protein
MRNFFKGKGTWRYVSGTYMIPKNTGEEDVVFDRYMRSKQIKDYYLYQ